MINDDEDVSVLPYVLREEIQIEGTTVTHTEETVRRKLNFIFECSAASNQEGVECETMSIQLGPKFS